MPPSRFSELQREEPLSGLTDSLQVDRAWKILFVGVTGQPERGSALCPRLFFHHLERRRARHLQKRHEAIAAKMGSGLRGGAVVSPVLEVFGHVLDVVDVNAVVVRMSRLGVRHDHGLA